MRFQEYVPEENKAARHVLERLSPYTEENGGPLKVQHISYLEGRGNIIAVYPGTTDKTVAFVGSHMDGERIIKGEGADSSIVVPAGDRSNWERDPFELVVDGDTLWGRGVTDCLGHVALITGLE